MKKYLALRYDKTFKKGANAPMLIGVTDNEGYKEDAVVKLMSGESMSTVAFMKETMGSFIAHELELNTPKACTVIIEDEFINSQNGAVGFQNIKQSKGLNYGTHYVLDLLLFTHHSELNKQSIPMALKYSTLT